MRQVEFRMDRQREPLTPISCSPNLRVSRSYHGRRISQAGMTLLELIIACGILLILTSAAIPMARVLVKRQKEQQLHEALRQVRNAIDRYKDAADQNLIKVEVDTNGYPPDLDTLVKGVQLSGAADKKVRFLRKVPVDPMTNNADWGLRSVQDDLDSTSWGGQNVFDIYSKSTATALDGTKYSDW
jgi:general secretion pathway protein G